MTFWAIVVAAGRGTRFGAPKHTVLLSGVPLWERARDSLAAAGADSVVIVGDVDGGIAGGERRRDSVAAGLAQVPSEIEYVLVHDAARPLASPQLATSVVSRLAADDVDAVVPGLAPTDAVKTLATGSPEAVDRAILRLVQTPQGFKAASLRAAHEAADDDAADDAELIERWGGSTALVAGEATNIKITEPNDLLIAAALLEGL